MFKFCLFSLCLILSVCGAASGQSRSINKIVDNTTLNEEEIAKINGYATYWTAALNTTNRKELNDARKKLVEPLEPMVGITPYARSIYGNSIKDGIGPILQDKEINEMIAVNALQVVSLLGTEQGCGILINHTDSSTEKRSALRLWASIGIGTTFQIGVLSTRSIQSTAKLLPKIMSREKDWYTIARQFDALISLQNVPGLDNRDQKELEKLSLELQSQAFVTLLTSINSNADGDSRTLALPVVLPSLLLQLVEPAIEENVLKSAENQILPSLIAFVASAPTNSSSIEENSSLNNAYRDAFLVSGNIINRILGSKDVSDTHFVDLWTSKNGEELQKQVAEWKKLSGN